MNYSDEILYGVQKLAANGKTATEIAAFINFEYNIDISKELNIEGHVINHFADRGRLGYNAYSDDEKLAIYYQTRRELFNV